MPESQKCLGFGQCKGHPAWPTRKVQELPGVVQASPDGEVVDQLSRNGQFLLQIAAKRSSGNGKRRLCMAEALPR